MNPRDNVGVCLRDLKIGETLDMEKNNVRIRVTVVDAVPLGHKVALESIDKGGAVVKYGEVIGKATRSIAAGEHAHVHNVSDY